MPNAFAKHLKQVENITSHQRLAAGNADLAHPAINEAERELIQLFKAEHFLARQEFHPLRHAIGAAQIAAVCYRKAKIADLARKAVHQLRRSNIDQISPPSHAREDTAL